MQVAPCSILHLPYAALEVKHTGHWLAKTGDMFKKLREELQSVVMYEPVKRSSCLAALHWLCHGRT